MHCDHPLANRTSGHVSDLMDESFVMLERDKSSLGFDLLLAACSNNGISPKIFHTASHIEAVLMMVDSEMGSTMLPKYFESYAPPPSLTFINIEGYNYEVDILASWKKINQNPSLFIYRRTRHYV